jgi:hypothetical protein
MSEQNSSGHFEVYWPRSPRRQTNKSFARRPPSLDGKVIGLLWDYLFRGDEVYRLLQEGLKERFPTVRFINWSEFGNMHGSDERKVLAELPGRLKELKVDLVLSAMAA